MIEDGVTSVGDYAFFDCGLLRSITIPDSVISIGSMAVCGCNNLFDIYYGGTEAQWEDITIGSDNLDLTNATIHFVQPTVEMGILENSYFESADKTKFDIGFVTDNSICHTDFKTLKFAFTDGGETTYMGYSMENLGLPVITSEDGAEILLGIVLNNIPMKFKDNVTLTLTSEELK